MAKQMLAAIKLRSQARCALYPLSLGRRVVGGVALFRGEAIISAYASNYSNKRNDLAK